VLGSIQPQPLDYEADGTLDLQRVEAAIKPDDPHFARTKLLALENTLGGQLIPMGYIEEATALAPGDVRSLLALAELRERQGDVPGALAALSKAYEKRPKDAEVAPRYGRLLSPSGKLDEASLCLGKLAAGCAACHGKYRNVPQKH